jgi:hypothetical protein
MCYQEESKKTNRNKLNGTHQILVYADDNLLDKDINITKKNKEALLDGRKEVCIEVNTEQTKYMFILQDKIII